MTSDEVHFRAPLGTAVMISTAAAYVLLGAVGAGAAWTFQFGPVARIGGWIALGTVLIIGLVSLGFRVRGYVLSGGGLDIEYGFTRRRVALEEITSIEPAREIFRGAWRVFASGGLWSFLGQFQSAQQGPFFAYVSDPARSVLIATRLRRLVVSPEDPTSFIGELKRRLPQLA